MPQAVKGFKTEDGKFFDREDDAQLYEAAKALVAIGISPEHIRLAHKIVPLMRTFSVRSKQEAAKCEENKVASQEEQNKHAEWHKTESIGGRLSSLLKAGHLRY